MLADEILNFTVVQVRNSFHAPMARFARQAEGIGIEAWIGSIEETIGRSLVQRMPAMVIGLVPAVVRVERFPTRSHKHFDHRQGRSAAAAPGQVRGHALGPHQRPVGAYVCLRAAATPAIQNSRRNRQGPQAAPPGHRLPASRRRSTRHTGVPHAIASRIGRPIPRMTRDI